MALSGDCSVLVNYAKGLLLKSDYLLGELVVSQYLISTYALVKIPNPSLLDC